MLHEWRGKGLTAAQQSYQNRQGRARELKGQGKKVIGYFCAYTPVELLTAAGLIPYRIIGNLYEPVTKADAYVETNMCPYVGKCFDAALKGSYEFLDGIVVPHTCDAVRAIYDIWKHYLSPDYCHLIDVPHVTGNSAHTFFKGELKRFKRSLEDFVGREISDSDLWHSVKLHNENRTVIRKLYEMRKQEPPLISGVEVTLINNVGMAIPVEETNELVRGIIEEVGDRPQGKAEVRLLIYGCLGDHIDFIQLTEDCGANVVIDDLCFGTRCYWHDVEIVDDLIDALATRYLEKINCPRTFRGKKPEEKYEYLGEFVKDFKVAGAILLTMLYCDPHDYEVPDVRDYLQGLGLPVLHLVDDYSITSIQQMRTRIEAFLEMIKGPS